MATRTKFVFWLVNNMSLFRLVVRCTWYSLMWLKFVIDLQQVYGFLTVLLFPWSIKLTAIIYKKKSFVLIHTKSNEISNYNFQKMLLNLPMRKFIMKTFLKENMNEKTGIRKLVQGMIWNTVNFIYHVIFRAISTAL